MLDRERSGRALVLQAHAANVQDRDGAIPLLQGGLTTLVPFRQTHLRRHRLQWRPRQGDRVRVTTPIVIEVVKKRADQVGFQVLPIRWVGERFFAWINRNRRLAKDFQGTSASAQAFLYAASVILLTRRMARSICVSSHRTLASVALLTRNCSRNALKPDGEAITPAPWCFWRRDFF